MLKFLLDTDHLTLLEHRNIRVTQKIGRQIAGAVGFPAVVVEESLRGRLTAIAQAKDGVRRISRYGLFLESLRRFQQFPIAPFDQSAEDQFQILRALHLRFGTRDQKIAAIALANNVILVTRNRKDFGQVPGLVIVDWSV
jgi:tRNA(fMet)-specific endonuclease VapC